MDERESMTLNQFLNLPVYGSGIEAPYDTPFVNPTMDAQRKDVQEGQVVYFMVKRDTINALSTMRVDICSAQIEKGE